jgi:hypothetical protein
MVSPSQIKACHRFPTVQEKGVKDSHGYKKRDWLPSGSQQVEKGHPPIFTYTRKRGSNDEGDIGTPGKEE